MSIYSNPLTNKKMESRINEAEFKAVEAAIAVLVEKLTPGGFTTGQIANFLKTKINKSIDQLAE